MRWQRQLRYDPLPPLLRSDNRAIDFFVERDLLGKNKDESELWHEKAALKIIHHQKNNGSWSYPGGKISVRSQVNYDQLETFRNLGTLIEKYNLNKHHPSIPKAANFLFSFQTSEGDFRGIYGNQYATTYSSVITELLIKAGYSDDKRVIRSLEWLLKNRQADGGWAIPFRTRKHNLDAIALSNTLENDSSMPSSHLVTGMALRALAAHPNYAHTPEVKLAGELLKSRFFKRDKYPDRQDVSFWTEFPHPFWFTDLLSSLDSLSRIGFDPNDSDIAPALAWFVREQTQNGLWNLRVHMNKDKDLHYWLALSICRVFQRFFGVK